MEYLMKKRLVSVVMAIMLAVAPAGSSLAEEIGRDNSCAAECMSGDGGEEILGDVIVSEEGDGGICAESGCETLVQNNEITISNIEEVETKVYDSSVEAAQEGILEFEMTEVLKEAGLACNASASVVSLFGNTVYTGSYGNQLDEDSKKIYDVMTAEYVTNRTAGQPTVQLDTANEELQFTVEEVPSDPEVLRTSEGYQNASRALACIMQPAYDAFQFDYPEAAWMGLLYYSVTVAQHPQDDGTYRLALCRVTLKPAERYEGAGTQSEIKAFDQAVASVTENLAAGFDEETSQEHKVKAIHDYLCDTVVYTNLNSTTDTSDHSAAGVFLKGGKAVCEGYAKAFKILCSKFDIECVLIPGYASGAHMWNYVRMEDGSWYMVDPTWDDRSTIIYTYFLIGNETVVSGTATLGAQRTLYTNFSGSEYAQEFVLPVLNSTAYARTHQFAYVSDGNATCMSDGTRTQVCTYGCGETGETVVDEGSKLEHVMEYVPNEDATCLEDGTKTLICEYGCGTIGKTVQDEGTKLGHQFTAYVADGNATCLGGGTKTAKCDRCDAMDTIADTETVGAHVWEAEKTCDKEPTCTVKGCESIHCQYCDVSKAGTSEAIETLPHIFTTYSSNNDATVFSDGTKTASCDAGCGTADTITDEGSKLTPTYIVNVTPIILQVGQSTSKVKVTGLAAGDFIRKWTSSNKKIVTVTQSGTIRGLKKGTAYVTVQLASSTRIRIKVTVQKTAVKTRKITGLAEKLTIKKGKKETLKPVLLPLTSVEKISYTSSNKKVAAVSRKGLITAKGPGTAKITVKAGKKKFVVTVTVPKVKTTAIKNVPKKILLTLKKKKTYQLKAKVVPVNSDQKFTYSSSKKSVAVVSCTGKITAKKKGTTLITVKSGSKKVKCRVTVK